MEQKLRVANLKRGKFENMYADDVNFTELNLEIAWFNRLVQSSGFTFKNDATAQDVAAVVKQTSLK